MKAFRKHYWLNKTKDSHAHCHIHGSIISWKDKDVRHHDLRLNFVVHDCSRNISLDFGASTDAFGPHQLTNARHKLEQMRRALCEIEKTLDKFEEEYCE